MNMQTPINIDRTAATLEDIDRRTVERSALAIKTSKLEGHKDKAEPLIENMHKAVDGVSNTTFSTLMNWRKPEAVLQGLIGIGGGIFKLADSFTAYARNDEAIKGLEKMINGTATPHNINAAPTGNNASQPADASPARSAPSILGL